MSTRSAAPGRLPDGTPYFGTLGSVAYDAAEDRVQCHLCGAWFRQVGGSHLIRTHGWTIDQYRRAFRLPSRIATCSAGISEQHRQAILPRIDGGDMAASTGRFARDRDAARAAGPTAARVRVRAPNLLFDRRPELSAEWHPTRNHGVDPATLDTRSPHSAWWRCSNCDFEWQATVQSRAIAGSRCPRCRRAARRQQLVEQNVRRAHTPHPSKPSLRVALPELAAELDPSRDPGLDGDVLLPGSRKVVWWRCATCGHQWQAAVHNRSHGTGCPACSGRYTPPERSLASLRPDLLAEWHPTRNLNLDPHSLAVGSGKRAWWRCSTCAHEWATRIESRTRAGTGCPECHRRRTVLPSLAQGRPDLAAELHPTLNGNLDLNLLRQWSWAPVWWRCPTCGHAWQTSPANRVRSRSHSPGCPACRQRH